MYDAGLILTIVNAVVLPIVGVLTVLINNKFNVQVLELKMRLQACEDRHANNDAEKDDSLTKRLPKEEGK